MDQLDEIRQAITRHAGDGLTATTLPGLSVLRTTQTIQPLGDVLEPAFALIASGVKHTALNGGVYRYGAGAAKAVRTANPGSSYRPGSQS